MICKCFLLVCDLSFHFFNSEFEKQKFLTLTKSNLFFKLNLSNLFFSFMDDAFGVESKISLPHNPRSEGFLPMFSYRSRVL